MHNGYLGRQMPSLWMCLFMYLSPTSHQLCWMWHHVVGNIPWTRLGLLSRMRQASANFLCTLSILVGWQVEKQRAMMVCKHCSAIALTTTNPNQHCTSYCEENWLSPSQNQYICQLIDPTFRSQRLLWKGACLTLKIRSNKVHFKIRRKKISILCDRQRPALFPLLHWLLLLENSDKFNEI